MEDNDQMLGPDQKILRDTFVRIGLSPKEAEKLALVEISEYELSAERLSVFLRVHGLDEGMIDAALTYLDPAIKALGFDPSKPK